MLADGVLRTAGGKTADRVGPTEAASGRVVLDAASRSILSTELVPKFLATVSRTGEPNVVPVLSLCPFDEGRLAFGEFMIWKTKQNLAETGRAAFVALDQRLNYVAGEGVFEGFVDSGPVFDLVANAPLFRYNPYNGLRGAGTLRLVALGPVGRIPTASLLTAHVRAACLARAAGSRGRDLIPLTVAEKFRRLRAVKAVAWATAGPEGPGVRVLPAAGVGVAGRHTLVVGDRAVAAAVPDGSRVAVAVITLDPVAYQVKGDVRRQGDTLYVE
ncbi:MAG: pyridoxamine 5'-phosphate oxidase family protein, partial [Firmicutes bacterium]|nr:pyridoxamine 5'-phosphate oxidase family protein [Bacillota bacterium]